MAESISGFAHINGQPDGPPTLPPFALGDGVASLFGTFGTMFALWHRDVHGAPGQVIDLAIYEPLFWLLGPQSLVYDQLGHVQNRTGSSTDWTAPRNAYQASDGRWLGLSASSQSIAERVMRLVGHPEVIDEPWFGDHNGRVENQKLLDRYIGGWIAEHTAAEVMAAFEAQQAVIGPIYSIADIDKDPQYRARETITTVDDPRLGPGAGPERDPAAGLDARPGAAPRWRPGPGQRRHPVRRAGPQSSPSWSACGSPASWAVQHSTTWKASLSPAIPDVPIATSPPGLEPPPPGAARVDSRPSMTTCLPIEGQEGICSVRAMTWDKPGRARLGWRGGNRRWRI